MAVETEHAFTPAQTPEKLRRTLTNRHIQLMAIGGAIGTGLFMGSGKTLSLAGPSIVFVYMIIGFILFFVMRAMGELLLSNLAYKSFSDFAADLLGPWAGFFTGWTYWFCWVVTSIADVVAISAYFQFWFPGFSVWMSALLCLLVFLTLNIATVKMFGELEFWFAIIKIVAIVALIIAGATLAMMHYPTSATDHAGLNHIWQHGGLMPHGLRGFFAGFQIAIFAFVGIELVGTAAAETADPARVLPRAINAIPLRVIMFYVLALLAIMVVTPWSTVSADRSPFVAMFTLTGLPAAASVVNFVVLTSAASSANSGIFSTSRMLFGLAEQGVAHRRFALLSRRAVPINGLLFSCLCLLVGVALIYLIPNVMTVFTLVTTVAAILFMFVWTIILCSYLVYRRNHPQRHQHSPFKMPCGIGMSWVCLGFFLFVLVLLALQNDTHQALLVTPVWFVALAAGWRWQRRKIPAHGQKKGPDGGNIARNGG
ncbi:D-serine/D-alanine/glycine transporter [Sodalis sp. (in: enterobacteria)]|uniref:D-serine/D-alanine/glycine transporter n=1 Tax=Sodalis sp. (in: enterobacteria) TaxID=1898979 RepID=UPI003F3B9AC0